LSKDGKGAKTSVSPAASPAQIPTTIADPPQTAAVTGHILVVDDTEANRDLAARRLERNGFTVDIASNGSMALELMKGKKYDAILLDVMMPGISGLDVLRAVRQSHGPAELPIIMATARGESQAIVEALRLGANDYVTKPLDFPVLLARLRTHLSLKNSVAQIRELEHGLEQRNAQLEAVNARMRGDLVAAAKVQAALLPIEGPPVQGYHFAWLFQPSAGLAGDILNVFALDDGHVGLYVLDVSGHGVAAALLSVTVSRFLSPTPDPSSLLWRRYEGAFELETPAVVADRLGRRFPFNQTTGQYFTMVYGLLSTKTHQLRFISAGHPNLLHVPFAGQPRIVEASGYPIGVAPPGPENYDEYLVEIAPGDRLFIHSDGVSEAMSPAEEMFGAARILDLLGAARSQPLEQSLKLLSLSVDDWTGHGERRDDQTVLAIERQRES
jgi:sigma-B regulation protein RsbU (phosphoserine phosphatase)